MIPVDPRLPANPQLSEDYLRRLNIRLTEILRLHSNTLNEVAMYSDPLAEVSLTGRLGGKIAKRYNIMGRRQSWVNTTSLHDIGEFLTTQNFPVVTGSESWEVVSSSANDDGSPAGTGAQEVHIAYLDADGLLQEVTGIVLNGTTPVAVPGLSGATFIQWMEVAAVGSGLVSAGNIDLRTVSGSVVHERISAGGNRSLSCRFKVPADCNGYMIEWDASANSNEIDFRIRSQSDMFDNSLSGPFLFEDIALVTQDTARDRLNCGWHKVPPLGEIKASAIPSSVAAGTRGDASFLVVCRKDL